jgi:hypothetical protein
MRAEAKLSAFANDFIASSSAAAIIKAQDGCTIVVANRPFIDSYDGVGTPQAVTVSDVINAIRIKHPHIVLCYCDRTGGVDVVRTEDCIVVALDSSAQLHGTSEAIQVAQISSKDRHDSIRRYVARRIVGCPVPEHSDIIEVIIEDDLFRLEVRTLDETEGYATQDQITLGIRVVDLEGLAVDREQVASVTRRDYPEYFRFCEILQTVESYLSEDQFFAALAYLEREASWYRRCADYGHFLLDTFLLGPQDAVLQARHAGTLKDRVVKLRERLLDGPTLVWTTVPGAAQRLRLSARDGSEIIAAPLKSAKALCEPTQSTMPPLDDKSGRVPTAAVLLGRNYTLGNVLASLELLDDESLAHAIEQHDSKRHVSAHHTGDTARDYLTYLAFYYARTSSTRLSELDRILSDLELDSLPLRTINSAT